MVHVLVSDETYNSLLSEMHRGGMFSDIPKPESLLDMVKKDMTLLLEPMGDFTNYDGE